MRYFIFNYQRFFFHFDVYVYLEIGQSASFVYFEKCILLFIFHKDHDEIYDMVPKTHKLVV